MDNTPEDIRIGIDIGGTFTDFVVYHENSGKLETFKLPSTPGDPELAVLNGLQRIVDELTNDTTNRLKIIHGSTVATNALLERKGAVTALVTTRGFKDVLQIGRQDRPALYDLYADRPPVLVSDHLRFEVSERIDSRGQVLAPLIKTDIDDVLEQLRETGVESVAICFLFSFLNDAHERKCAELLREAGYFVSVSSEILPEYREFERTSTIVVNAYVSPILSRYLSKLSLSVLDLSQTPGSPSNRYQISIMQSNGGIISLPEAQRGGVRCILSGPAGGVVGAQVSALQVLGGSSPNASKTSHTNLIGTRDHEANSLRLITFDMGGTSTDVSLIDGEPKITSNMVIGGCPIRLPLLDIHTIGAGGGSIASVDLGGALRVGPESAGADPGPACYGHIGDEIGHPTVTDANLLLGRMSASHFFGGQMPLDVRRSLEALSRLGSKMGLTPDEAALGIIDVVNAHMERALRVISVERGYDPREFTMLSFGGAGGLHAAELARRLGIRQIIVPRMASTLSALGMLSADVIKDYSQTVMLHGNIEINRLYEHFGPMISKAKSDMEDDGISDKYVILQLNLDIRYPGQSYELLIPCTENYADEFHRAHQKSYGYQRLDLPVEIVNLKLRAISHTNFPSPTQVLGGPGKLGSLLFEREVQFSGHSEVLPFYDGDGMLPGDEVSGPAVLLCKDTTVLVVSGFVAECGVAGDFVMVNGYTN